MNWKKKTTLFLTSQALSLFGSSLVQYAIIWYITLKTSSGTMMMISTLCAFLPQVLISFFAGVWADRYNKKIIIILSDAMIALSTLIIAILFLAGLKSIWILFVVLAIRSIGSGIQNPTTTSFIPEIVPKEKLMKINGINTTIQSIMLILSPAVSGGLLANVDLGYIFFIDVITAIIGISIFSFVKITFEKKEKEKASYFASIKEGVKYTVSHPFLSRILIYLVAANILITPTAILTPLLVTRNFGSEPLFLTLNEVVFAFGSIIGGIIISIWGGFKNRINTIGLGCVICGFFCVLIGLPFPLWLYLTIMGLMGITMPFFNTPFITLFQENVDKDKLGRVFSLISIVSGSIMPLSMVLFGPLADKISIEIILIITGILLVMGAVLLIKDQTIQKSLNKNINQSTAN